MSKSKGNTVDPEDLIRRYGADTVRLFIMFAAPPDQPLEWSDKGVSGAHRFLKRLWKRVQEHVAEGTVDHGTPAESRLDAVHKELRRRTHGTIAKVSDDIGRRYTFNTAIAAAMELLNAISRYELRNEQDRAVVQEALEGVVLILSPIVPHICHRLWADLGHEAAVVDESWPEADPDALAADSVEVVVQVNGKLRARLQVAADADEESLREAALADDNVQRFVGEKSVRKVIVVPGRLVNVVV